MQIHKLLIECWTTRGLNKIISQVDKPLYADQLTKVRYHINNNFARVLVEVDISKELPCHVPAILLNRIEVDLPMKFKHTLKFCIIYIQLGHTIGTCNEESQQQ